MYLERVSIGRSTNSSLQTFNTHNRLLQLFYTFIVSGKQNFGLDYWGDRGDRYKDQEDINTNPYSLSKMNKVLRATCDLDI